MMMGCQEMGEQAISLHQVILANYSSLYSQQKLTDVRLVIDGIVFHAHKLILASQSLFFEAMFFKSQMIESKSDEIHLKETNPEVFALLLEIVYHGNLANIEEIDLEQLVLLYILIERYQFSRYELALLSEIRNRVLKLDKFWRFFDLSVTYNVQCFIDMCFDFMETFGFKESTSVLYNINMHDYLKNTDSHLVEKLYLHPEFAKISYYSLLTILDRNFNISEILLFRVTITWIEKNLKSLSEEKIIILVKKIRLALMPESDILHCINFKHVICTDLVEALNISTYFREVVNSYIESCHSMVAAPRSDSTKLDKLYRKASTAIISNRSILYPNFNICQKHFGFKIETIIKEDYLMMDSSTQSAYIVINLNFPFMLNYVEMHLSMRKGEKFSYLLEYSIDGIHWSKLYDYRKYLCANSQMLFFNPVVIKYFRIAGTSQNRLDFRTRKPFESIYKFNAFFIDCHVEVRAVEGILLSPHYTFQIQHRVYCSKMVEEEIYHPVTYSPTKHRYYSHRILEDEDQSPRPSSPPDSGSLLLSPHNSSKLLGSSGRSFSVPRLTGILVSLDQPIMLSSFQFDLGQRCYSYVVDVYDHDLDEWCRVDNRSNERCTGWQTVVFALRPVNLMRVIGVKSFQSKDNQEFCVNKFKFNK